MALGWLILTMWAPLGSHDETLWSWKIQLEKSIHSVPQPAPRLVNIFLVEKRKQYTKNFCAIKTSGKFHFQGFQLHYRNNLFKISNLKKYQRNNPFFLILNRKVILENKRLCILFFAIFIFLYEKQQSTLYMAHPTSWDISVYITILNTKKLY